MHCFKANLSFDVNGLLLSSHYKQATVQQTIKLVRGEGGREGVNYTVLKMLCAATGFIITEGLLTSFKNLISAGVSKVGPTSITYVPFLKNESKPRSFAASEIRF